MLHSLPETRMIFEPFHAGRGIPSLAAHRYSLISAEADNGDLAAGVRRLLTKSSWNPWVEQFNPAAQFVYRRRLLKEVRINLLLPWLLGRFSDCRFVLLLRHPAAVVQSQVSGGWLLSPDRLYGQPGLGRLPWVQDLKKLDSSDEAFERNLLFWAIENRIALDAATAAGIPVMLYEELCVEPEAQLAGLERYLGTAFLPAATEGAAEASWSSSKSVADYSLEQKISSWQTRILPGQMTAMLRILEASGLNSVYGRESMPVASGLG